METKNIKQMVILDCEPQSAFDAWMDSKKHGEMVNGTAKIDKKIGGEFSIWDGAATGSTIEMDEKKYKVVQLWRYEYQDWQKENPSKITIEFVPYGKGRTKLRFWQTGIPEKYVSEIGEGWREYYWKPMQDYFKKLK